MTSLVSQLIADALRESGVIAVGTNPEADESAEALRVLNRLFRSLFGNELGDPLTSVNYGRSGLVTADAIKLDQSSIIDLSFIPANTRLILNNSDVKTVYLDPNPQDGSRFGLIDNLANLATTNLTVSGNGRKIEGNSTLVLNVSALNREWFYREDLGAWVRLTDLGSNDESPLPFEFDDLLISLLAIRLSPRYAAQADALYYKMMRVKLRSRYTQTVSQNSETGLTALPSNPLYKQYR